MAMPAPEQPISHDVQNQVRTAAGLPCLNLTNPTCIAVWKIPNGPLDNLRALTGDADWDAEVMKVATQAADGACQGCPLRRVLFAEQASRRYEGMSSEALRVDALQSAEPELEGIQYASQFRGKRGYRNGFTVNGRQILLDRDQSTIQPGMHMHLSSARRDDDMWSEEFDLEMRVALATTFDEDGNNQFTLVASSHNGSSDTQVENFVTSLPYDVRLTLFAFAVKTTRRLGAGTLPWTDLGEDAIPILSTGDIRARKAHGK